MRQVALEALRSERVARKWYAGRPVRPLVAAALTRAAKALGAPLPSPGCAEPTAGRLRAMVPGRFGIATEPVRPFGFGEVFVMTALFADAAVFRRFVWAVDNDDAHPWHLLSPETSELDRRVESVMRAWGCLTGRGLTGIAYDAGGRS